MKPMTVLCVLALLYLSLLATPAWSQKAPEPLTKAQIRQHQRIVGKIPLSDYKKIVLPGEGYGIGGVVGAPTPGWEQVCFDNGLCVNVVKTNGKVETTGGMGCHLVNRMGYTVRQIAAQIQQAKGPRNRLVPTLIDLVDHSTNIGLDLIGLENCYLDKSCNLPEAFKAFRGRHADYAGFKEGYAHYRAYMKRNPHALQEMPEAQAIIDYQLAEIDRIAKGVSVVYNPTVPEFQLLQEVELSPQEGKLLCNVARSRCRIGRP